jgi:hypothetical protein
MIRAIVLAVAIAAVAPAAAAAAEDSFARDYHQLLLQHTRWTETTWDEQAGHYQARDFNFSVVLGHAVLLRYGAYDEDVAGVPRGVLRDRTLRTIRHFAASNRWAGGTEWGAKIYWDSTFESYFAAAAKLLWDDLDDATRGNVEAIMRGAAGQVLGPGRDEATNGLDGAFRGNSRIEEMGAKSMPLAALAAFLPDDPSAGEAREWMHRWSLNMGGLPAADEANPALVEGRPVADWMQAHNVFDSFIVENHNSYAPIYQESMGAYPGRNAVQFLIAGKRLPESLVKLPNADELWATLAHLGTDAGLSAHLMVADRHHLYGRDILPLAYRTTVLGDRYAARAERMLADHMRPYVAHPPANRLTKFSGEPKYEPEARAELAMAYLLHRRLGAAEPVRAAALFERFAGATDYGAEIGLIAQQSRRALAAAVSKPGFVKFAYMPQHDDWLFDIAGSTASLIPSTATAVTDRSAHEYRRARDGIDATATLLQTSTGYAGFTTLPDGRAVYATSGLAADEGPLRLNNLAMPGVDGLDGDRTFSAAGGSVTLAQPPGLADGGEDDVRFAPVTARHVRFQGIRQATQFGYSLWDLEVYGSGGSDLARGRPTTASSSDSRFPPAQATDGDPATRWAVATAERPRRDSWLAVDLGAPQPIDRVALRFETAYAAEYRIQVSDDGQTWRDVATVPESRAFAGPWLNVDSRAGFVVRGSSNPISVNAGRVTLSAGPANPMVVEARPGEPPAATAAAAAAEAPSGGPPELRASLAGGHLSLFNLGAEPIEGAQLRLPGRTLFRGVQRTDGDGMVYTAGVAGADARVEPARFRLDAEDGARLELAVADSAHVRVGSLEERGVARVELRSLATGETERVTVPAGQAKDVSFRGPVTPADDLARSRTTFPTSPLPEGMSDPDRAVDGDERTGWRPGRGGRMVVDLGASHALGSARLSWASGRVPGARIAVSDDGLAWREVATVPGGRPRAEVALEATARYVALAVPGWRPGDAALDSLEVRGE